MKKPRDWRVVGLVTSVLIVILDQLSKYLVAQGLQFGQEQVLLPFLNIMLQHNRGAAFGFLGNAGGWPTLLFVGIAVIVSGVLLVWLWRLPAGERWVALAISFILGGAVGNLIDRLRLGYVIDFVDFYIKNWHFATFNLADSAISVGAALLLLNLLFGSRKTA